MKNRESSMNGRYALHERGSVLHPQTLRKAPEISDTGLDILMSTISSEKKKKKPTKQN